MSGFKLSRGPLLDFTTPPPDFRLQSLDLLRNQMRYAARAKALESKPARAMTQAEARDVTIYYALTKHIKIFGAKLGKDAVEKVITFDLFGHPDFPKPNEKVMLGLDDIGGVAFPTDNKKIRDAWKATGPLDPRLVVLVVRLAQTLKSSRWGVKAIYWGGMGINGDGPDQRHGNGFALDFHAADTVGATFNVDADWGKKPITLPNKKQLPKWPDNAVKTFYRLDDSDGGAGEFFNFVYQSVTFDAADGNTPGKPTSIGEPSRILHPDNPDPQWRPSHQDHIHIEIDR